MDRKHSYPNKNKWYSGKNNSHKNFNQNKNEETQLKTVFETHICEYCNQPIEELASAIANKDTGNPAHFDCVLSKINETEKLADNEIEIKKNISFCCPIETLIHFFSSFIWAEASIALSRRFPNNTQISLSVIGK